MKVILMFLMTINILGQTSMSSIRSEKIRDVFNNLRNDNTEILNDFYHKDIKFVDPIGPIDGLDAMKKYYQEMYKNVVSIRFDFKPDALHENTHLATWTMYLKADGLNSGEEISVHGVSEIVFDQNNLVTYHRDYFDMGAFVYEYIPILGKVIRMIKRKLSGH